MPWGLFTMQMDGYQQFLSGLFWGIASGGILAAAVVGAISHFRRMRLLMMHHESLAQVCARADAAERELHFRVEHFEQSQKELSAVFSDLSLQALQRNNELFLDLAEQALTSKLQKSEGELGKKHESVVAISDQIRRELDRIGERIQTAEKERATGHGDLTRHLRVLAENAERLGKETTKLSTALRASKVQGSWGEAQLRTIIEGLGLLPQCDFLEQSVQADGSRPDVIISLPHNRKLVLDAKAPISPLIAGEEVDAKLLSDALRAHIKQLSSRRYPEVVPGALDFTMMFLPAETICSIAMEHDPSIYTFALERKILLVTPLSIVGFLTLISSSWRALRIDENAQELISLGREVCRKVETFVDHFNKLGRSITATVKDYNSALGSFDTRLLPSLHKLHSVAGDSSAPPPAPSGPIFEVLRGS